LSRRIIYAALTFAMILWGLNVIAVKVLITDSPSVTINALRVTIAGLCVLLFTLFTEGFRKMNRSEWFYLGLAALLGISGHHLFLALGLKATTGTNGSLILALNPLTTAIFAFLFLKDRLTPWRVTGIAAGFTGVSFIILRSSDSLIPTIHLGDLFVFLAMVSQSLSFLAVRNLVATVPVNQVTALTMVIGALLLLPVGYVLEPVAPWKVLADLPGPMWVLMLISALFATALGGWIWNQGIRALGPGQTAVFINMTPFYGLVGASLFLGETITWSHILGFVFIVVGVLLGSGWYEEMRRKRKQNKEAEQTV
jgi:drug/metabolite transporter (DMT)-like permease